MTHVGTQTNLVLLGWTQEYLRSLVSEVNSDSILAAAWDEFYRVYDALMRRFALARGLRDSDVDDCLQAVWLEIATGLGNFERSAEQSGLRSWLYTLVRSKACDLFRRQARVAAESLDVARLTGHEPADSDADPRQDLDRQWKHALLDTLLEELRQEISDTNWRLLRMRFVEGREVADVASRLGISPEQVRYRQRRLVRKLRARMAVFTGQSLCGQENHPAGPGADRSVRRGGHNPDAESRPLSSS